MTIQEAIKWLDKELKQWEAECKSLHPTKDALRVAIKALEKADILEAENKKLKADCNKYWCKADCNECDHRCRAWQNGYNATCERECDNCEVIADMQSLKNVLNKLLFDYADDLRGDTE